MRRSLAVILMLLLPLVAQAKQWSLEYESKVGKEASAEVEKRWKVIADEAQQKQLDEIAVAIAAVSERPQVKYIVKIIDEKEVNAFSLPGGYVYVTKGLLGDVQSVPELAGVLAHEITHNTFFDALERADQSKKLFMGSLAATIGALILGAKGNDLSAVLAAGEYIRLGVLSHYSMKVELRADEGAVRYLIASKKYDPVGMLTFMERLAAQERHKPRVELGVYADHPDTDERVRRIIDQLERSGVDINRRAVTKWEPPKVEEKDVDGRKLAILSLWGVEIMRTDSAPEGQTATQRMQAVAEKLRVALAAGIQDYQITADTKSATPRVMADSDELITVTPQDAAVAGVTAPELATRLSNNLSAALHKESLGRWW